MAEGGGTPGSAREEVLALVCGSLAGQVAVTSAIVAIAYAAPHASGTFVYVCVRNGSRV